MNLLIKTRELLSDPARWTKGNFARDVEGRCVPSVSAKAVCWCLMGAMNKVCAEENIIAESLMEARSVLVKHLGKGDSHGEITLFNDNSATTHQDILNLLDKAIKCPHS